MRQVLSQKNTQKLAKKLGIEITKVMVRGGTDHRKDICLPDHTIIRLYNDGSMEHEGTWG